MAQDPPPFTNPPLTPIVNPAAGASKPVPDVSDALKAYCSEANVSWCALVEVNGGLLATASPEGFVPRNPAELSKMAADLLGASQRLASSLGEREFHGFLQAGDRWHYFISPVTDRTILLSVFGTATLPAAVRATAESHRQKIAEIS